MCCCLFDKDKRKFCICVGINSAIPIAFLLQAFEAIIVMAFLNNLFYIVPCVMCFLTSLAYCFGRYKAFRVFIFSVNVFRTIASFLLYGIWALFIFKVHNYPEKYCKKNGKQISDDTFEMKNGDVYDDLADCIQCIRLWYIFGFIFFYAFAVPCMTVYCQIFYYWMRDPALASRPP